MTWLRPIKAGSLSASATASAPPLDDAAAQEAPEDVAASWEVAKQGSSGWVPARAVRCMGAAAVAARIAAASPTIALAGPTPQGLKQGELGVFTKRAELVNGLPSYVKEGELEVMLWHTGYSWMVGKKSNLGKGHGKTDQRRQLGRERLGAGHTDFRAGACRHYHIGLARDGAARHINKANGPQASLAGVAHGHQRIKALP